MYLDFQKTLNTIHQVQDWSIQSLGDALQIDQRNFFEIEPGILVIQPIHFTKPTDYLLTGTLFFTNKRIAIRGTPDIFFPFSSARHNQNANLAEQELKSCPENQSIIFEEKIDGLNLRFFCIGEQYFFLPRICPGLKKNLPDFNFEKTARQILEHKYQKAFELVRAGSVFIFELISPALDFLSLPAQKEDLILIDVLKENKFLPRTAREEIASSTGLALPRVLKTINQPLNDRQFLKEMKSLEYMAHQLGIEGMVAKGQSHEGEQVFLKIKAQGYRVEHIGTSEIPRRIINEVLQSMKIELGWKNFINHDLSWPILLNELNADFILTDENRQKIEQYYESERKLVSEKLETYRNAQKILNSQKFASRKEIAQAAGGNSLLRQFLFQIWEESSHQ